MSMKKEIEMFENNPDFMERFNSTPTNYGADPALSKAEQNKLIKLCAAVDEFLTDFSKLYNYRQFLSTKYKDKGCVGFSISEDTALTIRKTLKEINFAVDFMLDIDSALDSSLSDIKNVADIFFVLSPKAKTANNDSTKYSYWNGEDNSWVYDIASASVYDFHEALSVLTDNSLSETMGIDITDVEPVLFQHAKNAYNNLHVIHTDAGTFWHATNGEVEHFTDAAYFTSKEAADETCQELADEFHDMKTQAVHISEILAKIERSD